MKTQLMILMFVVSVLLSSCGTPQPVREIQQNGLESLPSEYTEYYFVKPGDILISIARKYGINYKEIARRNNISPPYTLVVGQSLVIPQPNQPRFEPGIVISQPNQPTLGASSSRPIPSYPISRPGCGVRVVSVKAFTHRCKLFSQCTGVNYIIKNTSPVAKTVTVEYRYLEKTKVLRENVQIPADGLIDGNAYEVVDTVGPQNIVINDCY